MRLLLIGFVIAALGVAAGVIARNLNDDGPASVSLVAASVTDCPNGSILTTYTPGSRVFAIGRTEAADWIQVRDLSSPDDNVWVKASDIDLDAGAADLPVTDCPTFDGVVTVGDDVVDSSTTTTTTPEETTTTFVASTTTTVDGTTTTEPAPTTTETIPDTTPPEIKQPSATPAEIWEEDGLAVSCPSETSREATISAVVTDDIGVASVTASWSDPAGNQSVAMSGAGPGYATTFGPYAAGDWDPLSLSPYDHPVTITITATDTTENKSSTTISVTVWEIGKCLP